MERTVVLNNRYRLLSRLGSGGMAHVYKAQDQLLGRLVAVKLLHDSLTSDPVFIRRFEREAQAAARLTHPNIVTVHDVGQDGDLHYIVMEYVDGEDLKSLIRREAPLSVGRALDLTIQICAGVGYAHRADYVHCDVKPQNVLVTPDGRAKVTDFGIARALSSATIHTQGELVWGSPHYFAPEQAAGETPEPASDVYAIGVILYELLTGRLPFEADNPTALALLHLREAPRSPGELNPRIPAALEQIVLKVLSKERAARYRNAEQFGRILESYRRQGGEPTGAQLPVVAEPAALPVRTASARLAVPPAREPQTVVVVPPAELAEPAGGVDWVGIALAVLALVAIFGLIPLWAAVYYNYTRAPTPTPLPPTPIPALTLALAVLRRPRALAVWLPWPASPATPEAPAAPRVPAGEPAGEPAGDAEAPPGA